MCQFLLRQLPVTFFKEEDTRCETPLPPPTPPPALLPLRSFLLLPHLCPRIFLLSPFPSFFFIYTAPVGLSGSPITAVLGCQLKLQPQTTKKKKLQPTLRLRKDRHLFLSSSSRSERIRLPDKVTDRRGCARFPVGLAIGRIKVEAATLIQPSMLSLSLGECWMPQLYYLKWLFTMQQWLPARECFLSDGQFQTLKGTEAFCVWWLFFVSYNKHQRQRANNCADAETDVGKSIEFWRTGMRLGESYSQSDSYMFYLTEASTLIKLTCYWFSSCFLCRLSD